MKVNNVIALCTDGKQHNRNLAAINKIIIHRIEPELGSTAIELAKSFKNTTKYAAGYYTGGEMPYTFVVREDGQVDQALSISDWGPHARKYNVEGLGVAIIGNLDKKECHAIQWVNTIELCKQLTWWLGEAKPVIYGHTELEGASSDPSKKCPGKFFDMNAFRAEVSLAISKEGRDSLTAQGVVF